MVCEEAREDRRDKELNDRKRREGNDGGWGG